MERLVEDAINVKNLLPWIESNEDIINFMRKIPLDKSYLRNQLTLRYFLKQKDCYSDDFEKKIEDDAREIVIVMPDTSYKEIKEKLIVLGSMSNRKEIVVRQLLQQKRELDKVLRDINTGAVKKRKTESSDDIFGLDSSNNQTNINIKIRRVDGSLEVVSRISSQEKPSTSTNFSNLDEPTTSSASVTSSSNHSSNSSPDSTVPSTNTDPVVASPDTDPDDPCPEFTAILNDLINTSSKPSTSQPAVPVVRTSAEHSTNNNRECASVSNVQDNNEVIDMEVEPIHEQNRTDQIAEIPNSTVSNSNHTVDEPEFNLIDFVKELTAASESKIFKLCKQFHLDLNKRPKESELTYLLNRLLDDVVEIGSGDSQDSGSDTQEYHLSDEIYEVHPPTSYKSEAKTIVKDEDIYFLNRPSFIANSNPAMPYRSESKRKVSRLSAHDKAFIASSNNKEFKLKQPVFTFNPSAGAQASSIPKPIQRSPSIVQPARFQPSASGGIIPAMPFQYLSVNAHSDAEIHRPVENPPPEPPREVINLTVNKNLQQSSNFNNVSEAGPSNAKEKKRALDQNLVLRLIEMFPEACPEYIREICGGRKWADLDDVVTVILSAPDYPRRPERVPSPVKEVDPQEQFEIVKELLPDADPTYLRMQCEKFANDEKGFKKFINTAMEVKDYPTMKEYLRKQQLSAQQKQYTTEFNIENFMQLFPEPENTFKDPKRTVKIDSYSNHYLNIFFRNRYEKISQRIIQVTLQNQNFKALQCDMMFEDMVRKNETMKSRRRPSPLPENLQNIPLLQELAYLTHREDIKTYLQEKLKREEQERIEAKENGLMETCQCCYDEEVMPKDTFTCPNGCRFCRDCILRSCEVAVGEGKTDFPCLADCSTEFTLQTLQSVVPPKMFSKLAQKKALAEIKAAGIEELETCPFCDFASIPNEADKIFRCLNPDCMKESCRKCKEPNHVPLKCEEVEKDQDVKARTYIENKMTEALIRKCWKCGTSFFKEEGCNKMTCSCGAKMCYICQQPVKDYSHFNGIGGDKHNLCPLYSDTNQINKQNVLTAAQAAKAEIDPSALKVDPTVGIKDHFDTRAKKLPREPHMELLHRINRNGVRQHIRHRHRHRNHNPLNDEQQLRRFAEELRMIQQQWELLPE